MGGSVGRRAEPFQPSLPPTGSPIWPARTRPKKVSLSHPDFARIKTADINAKTGRSAGLLSTLNPLVRSTHTRVFMPKLTPSNTPKRCHARANFQNPKPLSSFCHKKACTKLQWPIPAASQGYVHLECFTQLPCPHHDWRAAPKRPGPGLCEPQTCRAKCPAKGQSRARPCRSFVRSSSKQKCRP